MSGGTGGHCPAGRGHRAARSSRAEPGDAKGLFPAPWSRLTAPDPPRPLTCWPGAGAAAALRGAGLPRWQELPARAGSRPRSVPRLWRKRRRAPAPRLLTGLPRLLRRRQGPGRRGGGPGGEARSPEPESGSGSGAGALPGRPPSRAGELPARLPARRVGPSLRQTRLDPRETSCRHCRVSLCCPGLGSRPVGSGAPAVRGSGASWSSRQERTQAWRCGGSEGVVISEGIAQSPSENQTSGAAALLNFRCLLVKQVQEIK